MRDLVIEKLVENKVRHAKNVWHWGKDKLKIHENALRREYSRLADDQLLYKYEELVENVCISNWRDYV